MQREMMQAAVATIYDEVLSKWRGDLFLPTVAAPWIRHNRNACEWYRRRGRCRASKRNAIAGDLPRVCVRERANDMITKLQAI